MALQRESPPTGPARRGATAADGVSSILAAAEATAERLRVDAEARLRDRIAEGDRAADYRIKAAEEEAAEILASARSEAERLVRDGRERGEEARTTATSEALTIVANAQESAARERQEADAYRREVIGEARLTAQEVCDEGLELVANLRQMGDALRSNAERLLRDVQGIHSHMVARLDRVEAPRPSSSLPRRPRRDREADADGGGDIPDVPEFIPRR